MQVFIRDIAGDTRCIEIAEFVEPTLKGGLFRTKGNIIDIKIYGLRPKHTNRKPNEFHGIVTIEPNKVAVRAIKKLNGQRFKGKRTLVREFFLRKSSAFRSHERRRDLELVRM